MLDKESSVPQTPEASPDNPFTYLDLEQLAEYAIDIGKIDPGKRIDIAIEGRRVRIISGVREDGSGIAWVTAKIGKNTLGMIKRPEDGYWEVERQPAEKYMQQMRRAVQKAMEG